MSLEPLQAQIAACLNIARPPCLARGDLFHFFFCPLLETANRSPSSRFLRRNVGPAQTISIGNLAFHQGGLLPIELGELQAANYNLGLLGFDQDELAKLLGGDLQEGLTDPDEVPEPPDEAITQPGDLWVLGDHRLLCADSSKPEDVDRLLDGAVIHLVNTDPPYTT